MHERIQSILDDIEKSGEKVRNINVFLNDPGTTVVINYSKGEGRQTEPIDLVKRDQLDQTLNTLAARDRVEGSGGLSSDVPQQGRYNGLNDSGHVSPNLHNPCPPQASDEHPGNDEEECDSDDDDDDDDESGDEEEKEEDCDSAASDDDEDDDEEEEKEEDCDSAASYDDEDYDDDDEEEENTTQQRTIAAAYNSDVSRLRDDDNCDDDEEEENRVEGEYDDDDDDDEIDDDDGDDDENMVKDTGDNKEEENTVVEDEDDGDDKEDTMVKDGEDDCDDEGDEAYMVEDEGDDDGDLNYDDDSSRQGARQRGSRDVDPSKEIDNSMLISVVLERLDKLDKGMDSLLQKLLFKSVTVKSEGSPDSKPSASEKDCVLDSSTSAGDKCNRDKRGSIDREPQTHAASASPNLHNQFPPRGSDQYPVNDDEDCESDDDDDDDYNECGGEDEKEEDCDSAAANDDGDDDNEEEDETSQQGTIAHDSDVDRSREDDDDDCNDDEEEENEDEDGYDDNNDEEENMLEDEDDDCDNIDEEDIVVLDEGDCDNDDDEEYMREDEGDDDADVNDDDDDDDSSRQGAEPRSSREVDPSNEIDKRMFISICQEFMESINKNTDSLLQKSTFKGATVRGKGSPNSKPSTSEKDCVSDMYASTSDECNKDDDIMTDRDQEKHIVRESSINVEPPSCKSEGDTVIAKGDLRERSAKLTQISIKYLTPSPTKTTLCEENSDKAQSSTSGNESESSERAKESEHEELDKDSTEYIGDVLYGIKTECTKEEFAHKIRDPTRNKEIYRVVQSKYPYFHVVPRDLFFNCVYDDIIVVFSYTTRFDKLYHDRYCKLYDSWWRYANTFDGTIVDSTHPLYPRIVERAMGAVDFDLSGCLQCHPLPSPPSANDEDGEADAANGEDKNNDDDDDGKNDYE